jgi:hypothetical protein
MTNEEIEKLQKDFQVATWRYQEAEKQTQRHEKYRSMTYKMRDIGYFIISCLVAICLLIGGLACLIATLKILVNIFSC